MTNAYGIPESLEKSLIKSIKNCVYCNVKLKDYPDTKGTPSDKGTWEHIDNDGSMVSESNVVRCCAACNASKGTKKLKEWLQSDYCKRKNITAETVTNKQVRDFLKAVS